MKLVASSMKEACAENAAIWEAALECYKWEFRAPSDNDCDSDDFINNLLLSNGIVN